MPRRKSAEAPPLPEGPVAFDSETAQQIIALLGELRERLHHLDGRIAVLTDALDDFREDYEWTMRNREPSGEEPFRVVSMSVDPCADDFALNALDRPAVIACSSCGTTTTTTIPDAMRAGWQDLERDDEANRDCTGVCPPCSGKRLPPQAPSLPATCIVDSPAASSNATEPPVGNPLRRSNQGRLF